MNISDVEITMHRDEGITPRVKSSYSNTGANCVELARGRKGEVAVRDSKDPDGGLLAFAPARWAAFTRLVKKGALDMA